MDDKTVEEQYQEMIISSISNIMVEEVVIGNFDTFQTIDATTYGYYIIQ